MAGKTRHPDRRTGSTRANNVVRLRPRQWLETLDDLVPIGGPKPEQREPSAPAADAQGSIDTSRPVSGALRGGEQPADMAREPHLYVDRQSASCAASAFWGGDTGYVHGALHVPVHSADPEAERPPRERPFAATRRLGTTFALTAAQLRARLKGSAPVRLRGRAAVALIASVAVVAAFLTAIALSGASVARPAPTASRAHANAFTDPGNEVDQVIKMLAPTRIPPLAGSHVHAARPRPASRHGAAPPAHTATRSSVAPVSASVASATRVNEPAASGPAGPNGPVSLIGAGTSPSG